MLKCQNLGDGLYKLEVSDQIPIVQSVQSVNLYVIVFRNKYCLNQNANNCWHFNIYEQEKFHAQLS